MVNVHSKDNTNQVTARQLLVQTQAVLPLGLSWSDPRSSLLETGVSLLSSSWSGLANAYEVAGGPHALKTSKKATAESGQV
jgi:hypothetical protein